MFAELVKRARTFRRFDASHAIPIETLMGFVDLARLVPCGGNSQKLRYRIVSKSEDRSVLFPSLAWAAALKDWPGPAEGERPTGYILILSETDGSTAYWRSADGVHHVPKRGLDEDAALYTSRCWLHDTAKQLYVRE